MTKIETLTTLNDRRVSKVLVDNRLYLVLLVVLIILCLNLKMPPASSTIHNHMCVTATLHQLCSSLGGDFSSHTVDIYKEILSVQSLRMYTSFALFLPCQISFQVQVLQ